MRTLGDRSWTGNFAPKSDILVSLEEALKRTFIQVERFLSLLLAGVGPQQMIVYPVAT